MTRSMRTALSVTASLLLVAGSFQSPSSALADGGGRQRGGFSRTGPGANGSFSAPKPAAEAKARQTQARQAGATERSAQRAEARTAAQQERTERTEIRQQGQTERTEARQQGQTERTEARQQGRTERTEARAAAATNVSNNWDGDRYYVYEDNDNGWGYALAGAAVGATIGVIAGTAAAKPAPTYVTVLPCTPVTVVYSGINYYGCGTTWYNKSYVQGNVTYVIVTPPPGY